MSNHTSNTWYVQLSEKVYNQLSKTDLVNGGFFEYDRGYASMKVEPAVGDCFILLAKKHEISKGFIQSLYYPRDRPTRYILYIDGINPVFTGKYYRRNWTLIKRGSL